MRSFYQLLLLLFLSAAAAAQPVQPLEQLLKKLEKVSSLQRIVLSSRHLDSMLVNGSPPKVDRRIDSLLLQAKKWNDQEMEGYLVFYDKIKEALPSVPHDKKVTVFKSAISYFEEQKNDRYTGVAHYYLGQYYYEKKQFGDAFYHHAKAQELFNKVGIRNIIDIGKYLHVLALDYYYFGYYEKVIQLMKASLTVPAFNENLDIQRYNTLGSAYEELGKLDSAAYYFRQTKQVAAALRDTIWINLASGNLGSIYAKQGRYQDALLLLMKDYRYNQHKNRHPVVARNAAVAIAANWQKLGREDSVQYYLRQSERLNAIVRGNEPMWKEQRDEQFRLTYYRVYHEYYKGRSNTLMAYNYLDSLTQLQNETDLRYNKMTAQVAEDRLKIQQHLADIAMEQAEKKRISTRLRLVTGIAGLVAVILGLLYYLSRLRDAKRLLLAEKEKMLRRAAHEKTEAQLAEAQLELTEYMQRLQEKNQLVETFESQIDHLRAHAHSESLRLDELTNRLAETKLLTADDWNDFRQRFNRAYGGQLDHLKMQYTDLTSAEERIYALEKMNVSSAQMAWMLGISQESVRKARYRLRKRIGSVGLLPET